MLLERAKRLMAAGAPGARMGTGAGLRRGVVGLEADEGEGMNEVQRGMMKGCVECARWMCTEMS